MDTLDAFYLELPVEAFKPELWNILNGELMPRAQSRIAAHLFPDITMVQLSALRHLSDIVMRCAIENDTAPGNWKLGDICVVFQMKELQLGMPLTKLNALDLSKYCNVRKDLPQNEANEPEDQPEDHNESHWTSKN